MQWLPTWNVGGRWNIHREDFLWKSKNTFKLLALRASYGLTAKTNSGLAHAPRTVFTNVLTHRPNINDRENALKILHLSEILLGKRCIELNDIGLDVGFLKE